MPSTHMPGTVCKACRNGARSDLVKLIRIAGAGPARCTLCTDCMARAGIARTADRALVERLAKHLSVGDHEIYAQGPLHMLVRAAQLRPHPKGARAE